MMTVLSTQLALDPHTAWERYCPSARVPWDLARVGHLYRRAAFGASVAELQTAVRNGPDITITALLQGTTDTGADDLWPILSRSLARANNADQLPALWLYRMLYSPHPLREKLTLFWHHHFATSNLKVRNVGSMLQQYELLRRHAQGNFRALLIEMSRDPAMLVWLDTVLNRRQQPNENYARELMELFSLGIHDPRHPGRRNYSEEDIRQAARAFTGWRIENGRGIFRSNEHDSGEKVVLGQRGRWQADDIVRICLEQEAAPYFILRKLFRFLVSENMTPTVELLEPLAQEFRRDFDFGAIVERILRSNLFFSPEVHRSRIKSPVEFTLGIVRGLEGHRRDESGQGSIGTLELGRALEGLGQKLFYPPSVAGWEGGRAWLNGQTLLLRHNLASALTSTTDDRFGRRLDPALMLSRSNVHGEEAQMDYLARIFLQGEISTASRERLLHYATEARHHRVPVFWTRADLDNQRVRTLCHLILCLPEFQLC